MDARSFSSSCLRSSASLASRSSRPPSVKSFALRGGICAAKAVICTCKHTHVRWCYVCVLTCRVCVYLRVVCVCVCVCVQTYVSCECVFVSACLPVCIGVVGRYALHARAHVCVCLHYFV